jgi:hypothetical protein
MFQIEMMIFFYTYMYCIKRSGSHLSNLSSLCSHLHTVGTGVKGLGLHLYKVYIRYLQSCIIMFTPLHFWIQCLKSLGIHLYKVSIRSLLCFIFTFTPLHCRFWWKGVAGTKRPNYSSQTDDALLKNNENELISIPGCPISSPSSGEKNLKELS